MALITQGAIDTIWAELKAEIDKAIEKRMPPGVRGQDLFVEAYHGLSKAWIEIATYEDALRIARRVLDRVYMSGGITSGERGITKDHRSG